jgi:hypothetical protein
MTDKDDSQGARQLVQRLAFPVRRAFAPAALELAGQVRALMEEIASLREETAALRSRAEAAEGRLAALDVRSGELQDGLTEARRLNIRVAELTDVVTELVLPLHDREIDAARLLSLRPDTR